MSVSAGVSPAARRHDLLARPLPGDHLVHFYRHDEALVEMVGEYAGQGLGRHETVLLVVTADHRRAIREYLTAHDLAVSGLERLGCLLFFDAAKLLASLLRDGMPDETLFRRAVEDPVAHVVGRGRPLRMYGEMVDLLWQRGEIAAAERLEALWNDLLSRHRAALFCAYRQSPPRGADGVVPTSLRDAHTHVV